MAVKLLNLISIRFITVATILFVLCMLSINTGQCRPSIENKQHAHNHRARAKYSLPKHLDAETLRQIQPCYDDEATMVLCQRCTKESKSRTVFPLCCANIDQVQGWCEKYISFGM